MPPKNGITWDAEADQKILLHVLADKNITVDWQDLATKLSSDSGICTVGALQKHVSRLRTKGSNDAGGSGEGPPSTPASKNTSTLATPATNKGKGKARAKKRPAPDSDSGDENNARCLRRKVVKVDPNPLDDTPSRVKREPIDKEI